LVSILTQVSEVKRARGEHWTGVLCFVLENLLGESDARGADQLVPDPEFEEPDYDVGVKQR